MFEQTFSAVIFIFMRGLEVSLTIMTPLTLFFYAATFAVVYAAYFYKGSKFGALVHTIGGLFLFFLVWNHPAYGYYKRNPWNGGYVYAAVMIITYLYVPMKLAVFATEFWQRFVAPPKA